MKGRRERGNVIVEFACGSVLLFLVISGSFQFGYSFYSYTTLENAVHEGARYASLQPYDSATATPSAAYATSVQNLVVYGTPTPGGSAKPIVPGLTTANVSVTVTPSAAGTLAVPSQVTVSIVNFTVNAVFGALNLNGRPFASFPYMGVLTPPTS